MNHYQIWCNLLDPHKDLAFAEAVRSYMGFLQQEGAIEGYSLTRRKLGFGPPELGEFNVTIHARDLAQLEQAFSLAATRSGDVERLHARVYSLTKDFRAGLFRDFPDPERAGR